MSNKLYVIFFRNKVGAQPNGQPLAQGAFGPRCPLRQARLRAALWREHSTFFVNRWKQYVNLSFLMHFRRILQNTLV